MKKILSLTLSLVMLFTTLSMGVNSAFANSKFTAKTISEGDTYSFSLKNEEEHYIKFVPTKNGAYQFNITLDSALKTENDYFASIVESQTGEWLNIEFIDIESKAFTDKESKSFAIGYTSFVAGKAYYIEVDGNITDAASVSGTISVASHTAHKYERQCRPAVYSDMSEMDFGIYKENGEFYNYCSICTDEKKLSTIYRPSKFVISKKKYVYDGKAKKPTVAVYNTKGIRIDGKNFDYEYENNKKVGTATVSVNASFECEKYTVYKPMTFTIVPKSTSISSANGTKAGFTVKYYKRSTQTTGYQVKYSKTSDFSKSKTVTQKGVSKTSYKATKLKANQKYYIKVRTYKTVDNKNYYSSWSKVKAVKTK